MKLFVLLFLLGSRPLPGLSQFNHSPKTIEKTIRQLELQQCKAIVNQDTLALFALWADDFVVNTPSHQLATRQQAVAFIRTRQINYSFFESQLESIQVAGDVAITMGRERIRPVGAAPLASQEVTRRYTQVWMKRNGGWQLVARHAHNQ